MNKLLVAVSILLSIPAFAENTMIDASKNARILPDVILASGKDFESAELKYDSRSEQYGLRSYEIQARLAELQERSATLASTIPELKKDRDYHRKLDGCWNTLGKSTTEYNCTAPFSGDTRELKDHWARARAANDQLQSDKAEKKKIAQEIKALEKESRQLEKERAVLRKKEDEDIARMQKIDEDARKQAEKFRAEDDKQREKAIAAEERSKSAQSKIEQRQQRKHERDLGELRNQIKRRDVQSAFQDLKIQDGELLAAIRLIEEEYDKSLMGMYMQKKMTTLLESDLLCKKVAECKSGRTSKVSEEEILKIFPNATVTPRSTSGSAKGNR